MACLLFRRTYDNVVCYSETVVVPLHYSRKSLVQSCHTGIMSFPPSTSLDAVWLMQLQTSYGLLFKTTLALSLRPYDSSVNPGLFGFTIHVCLMSAVCGVVVDLNELPNSFHTLSKWVYPLAAFLHFCSQLEASRRFSGLTRESYSS